MKLFIFGDSHTRSFMDIKNIYPFFFGPGQNFNLNNNSYNNIIVNIHKFFNLYNNVNSSDNIYFLYFGEPNCRYLVDNNYYPFKIDINLWKNYKSDKNKLIQLNEIFRNYDKIINTIEKYTNNYYIITPTTGFHPTLYYMNYFNKYLSEKYNTKVINLYDNILINDNELKNFYLNKNLQYDPIHLNSNIVKLFLDILERKKIIHDKNIYVNINYIDNKFKKHDKFNTYVV